MYLLAFLIAFGGLIVLYVKKYNKRNKIVEGKYIHPECIIFNSQPYQVKYDRCSFSNKRFRTKNGNDYKTWDYIEFLPSKEIFVLEDSENMKRVFRVDEVYIARVNETVNGRIINGYFYIL